MDLNDAVAAEKNPVHLTFVFCTFENLRRDIYTKMSRCYIVVLNSEYWVGYLDRYSINAFLLCLLLFGIKQASYLKK